MPVCISHEHKYLITLGKSNELGNWNLNRALLERGDLTACSTYDGFLRFSKPEPKGPDLKIVVSCQHIRK
jgi:hypothetical protein